MLRNECLIFVRRIRDSHESQKEKFDQQYQELSLKITQSQNIQELEDLFDDLIEFDITKKTHEVDEKSQYTSKNHYHFFSPNQKIFTPLGFSVGLIWEIAKICECYVSGLLSFDKGLSLLLYNTLYGSIAGYVSALLVDHIESIVEGDFRINTYIMLLNTAKHRIEQLQKNDLIEKNSPKTAAFLI